MPVCKALLKWAKKGEKLILKQGEGCTPECKALLKWAKKGEKLILKQGEGCTPEGAQVSRNVHKLDLFAP